MRIRPTLGQHSRNAFDVERRAGMHLVRTSVVNDEEQYSTWPAGREPPLGWRAAGLPGPKRQVLARTEATRTDLRPLSPRRKMEEAGITAG